MIIAIQLSERYTEQIRFVLCLETCLLQSCYERSGSLLYAMDGATTIHHCVRSTYLNLHRIYSLPVVASSSPTIQLLSPLEIRKSLKLLRITTSTLEKEVGLPEVIRVTAPFKPAFYPCS